MHSWKCAKNSTIKVKECKHIKIMMAYFNNLILLILWMIMIGTSNTGESNNIFLMHETHEQG